MDGSGAFFRKHNYVLLDDFLPVSECQELLRAIDRCKNSWSDQRKSIVGDITKEVPDAERRGYRTAVQKTGCSVALLEPGAQGAKNARLRGIDHVICSTFEDAHLAGESMPAAGAFDVLEHVQDDLGFLRSIVTRLVPGGRLYLTVPALPILWSQDDDEAGHYRRYTASALSCLLRRANLRIEYLTYFFGMLPPPILLSRAIPYRIGLRRSRADPLNRATTEHNPPNRFAKFVLNWLQEREAKKMISGRTMAMGSSCLAVARKT